MTAIEFSAAFKALTGHAPFPWQAALYERFVGTDIPASCNIPTGLGKTNVIAVWLLALATKPKSIPRRLVYVVNRRTVVDQTTTEVENIRENLTKTPKLDAVLRELCSIPPDKPPLAISTLRGQFADNREWSADPSRPAIICGTVDMIGSRLLFSGYGLGFKTRPLHAGFLGQDVLLVHDEAHLEPAFQDLLSAIQREQKRAKDLLNFRVVELTATSRGTETPFQLTAEDFDDERVQKRIRADKGLRLHPLKEEKKLAEQIANLALAHQDSQQRVLIFVQAVADVGKIQELLLKAKIPRERIETLTGTLRGKERDNLVNKPLFQRFLKASEPPEPAEYLICTSAGEVGVNISAQQLITDLTTFESMAQRFGRVNRFGDASNTTIDVVHSVEFDDNKELERRRRKTLLLLTRLDGDASPESLGKLDEKQRQAAFAPGPTTLPTTDFLLDAWSLTSIRDRLPGRPPVAPYLHGESEYEPPETHIAWRQEVSELQRLNESFDRQQLARFATDLLEDYPLKPIELLRDRSDRMFNTLKKLAAPELTPVWLQTNEGAIEVTTLGEIANNSKERIDNLTVILPPQAGGLQDGLFTGANFDDARKDDYDVADEWRIDGKPMRKRVWNMEPIPDELRLERTIQFPSAEDESAEPDAWYWCVRVPEAPSVHSRKHSYPLQTHLNDTAEFARQIVAGLQIPEDLKRAIVVAAMYHDLGKCRKLWQQSIGNRQYLTDIDAWAKSGQRIAALERTRYRHEFGSIKDVSRRAEFDALSPELQQLVLHLIAAHHGRSRPHFASEEAFDLECNEVESRELAAQVAVRYARLQHKFGRWGLAYLESLVRAADILASQKAERGAK